MLKAIKSRVIINADDLGISLRVNDAIFDLLDRHRITSATLLAAGPAFDDAVSRIPQYPHCSFGVHLNLTQFAPLSEKSGLDLILDEKGEFAGNKVRLISLDSGLKAAIHQEWRAQIEKISSAGVKISHLDGHQHIHTVPTLFFVLKQIQREFNIQKVRISRTFVGKGRAYSLSKRLCKSAYNLAMRHYPPTRTTDEFGSFWNYISLDLTRDILPKSVELMTHPGHKGYAEETRMLDTEWQQNIPYSIELVNYNEL